MYDATQHLRKSLNNFFATFVCCFATQYIIQQPHLYKDFNVQILQSNKLMSVSPSSGMHQVGLPCHTTWRIEYPHLEFTSTPHILGLSKWSTFATFYVNRGTYTITVAVIFSFICLQCIEKWATLSKLIVRNEHNLTTTTTKWTQHHSSHMEGKSRF